MAENNSDIYTFINKFKQNWQSILQSSPGALNSRIYEERLKFENNFNTFLKNDAIILCKLWTYNHHLPIESGRWTNIPRHDQDLCLLKLTQNRRWFALYTKP